MYKVDAFPVTRSEFPCGMCYGQTPSTFPASEHPPCEGQGWAALPQQSSPLGPCPGYAAGALSSRQHYSSCRSRSHQRLQLPHLLFPTSHSTPGFLIAQSVRSSFIPTGQEKIAVRARWIFFLFFFSSSYSPAFLFPFSRDLWSSFFLYFLG